MNKSSKFGILIFVLGLLAFFLIVSDILLYELKTGIQGDISIPMFISSIILGFISVAVGIPVFRKNKSDKMSLIGSIFGFLALITFFVYSMIQISCAC